MKQKQIMRFFVVPNVAKESAKLAHWAVEQASYGLPPHLKALPVMVLFSYERPTAPARGRPLTERLAVRLVGKCRN